MTEKRYLFFDSASTTKCSREAAELVMRFTTEDYGNPSSSHAYGQKSSQAIREARVFFATVFGVNPDQIIFTGSGSEADNLALYGVCLARPASVARGASQCHLLVSSIEHPAVRNTALSLKDLGVDVEFLPSGPDARVRKQDLLDRIRPETTLISIQHVNNIVGTVTDVEALATAAKAKNPHVVFHTDSVQAFGKVPLPKAPSAVDLVSISGHKVHGPKGVGALIVLNRSLLKGGLRPLIWGGEQEGGFRSGTQNAGLIAGFHSAARDCIEEMETRCARVRTLQQRFRDALTQAGLLTPSGPGHWNSPDEALPHIVSLSFPKYPTGPLSRLLEERGCLVSTGSACSSAKSEPDRVLQAMGFDAPRCESMLRISFDAELEPADVDTLVSCLKASVEQVQKLLGPRLK